MLGANRQDGESFASVNRRRILRREVFNQVKKQCAEEDLVAPKTGGGTRKVGEFELYTNRYRLLRWGIS